MYENAPVAFARNDDNQEQLNDDRNVKHDLGSHFEEISRQSPECLGHPSPA